MEKRAGTASSGLPRLTDREAQAIGRKIWLNETGGQPENLIVWNDGEAFASLGIGHFIWYPPGKEGPFEECFPALLQYFQRQQIELPDWLHAGGDCPWTTQKEFDLARHGAKMRDVRKLLTHTVPQQVEFLMQRLERALPKMLAMAPTEEGRAHVREQFYRVANTPQGMYALADYVNFKGEGTASTERYQDQGWGLLDVLQQMPGTTSNPIMEFADAAEAVLMRRIRNAPPHRQAIEARWLPGWKNRIETYRGRYL